MSLVNVINNMVNEKREKRIRQIQKRVDEMSEKWWKEQIQKMGDISQYYYKKSDEEQRIKILVLKFNRQEAIYDGYREILEKAIKDNTFDIDSALEQLKKKIAECDNEIKKWQKQLHRYEGSEKYDLRS